jgi:glycerol uptake facilitator-like aquaporin
LSSLKAPRRGCPKPYFQAGFVLGRFASNGYGDHSPGWYSLLACLVAEVVLTFMFLIIILGATDRRAPQGFAPLAIGIGLTEVPARRSPTPAPGAGARANARSRAP